MTPADALLNHFDRLCGSTPRFVRVSDHAERPAMRVAIYSGFPEPRAMTGFTIGLSHAQPSGGAQKELVISMRDSDTSWALAAGFLALQLRERCPFACGSTIDFHAPIAASSAMSAFLVIHSRNVSAGDVAVETGVRRIELAELVPLYEAERA